VYGPGLKKQLIWDVYQKAKQEKSIVLSGTGEESRDFIYVGDLARALFVDANEECEKLEIYNIGSGDSITVNDIVCLLFQKLEWQKDLSFNKEVRIGDPGFGRPTLQNY
jgi:nucleoside-diphosphate-sugar epimerase